MPRKQSQAEPPDRNAALAELIRVRRTQLRVPDGTSYSQEHVAERIGTTDRTLRAIENGELRRKDAHVLDALARELDMSPGERRVVYLMFNGHEPRPIPGVYPPDCVDDHVALIKDLSHPAYVTDMRWNVLATNKAVGQAVPGFEAGVNVFEWILSDENARQILVNWYDVWAMRTMRSLKTYMEVTGDPFLTALYRKLHRCVERADDVIGYFDPSGEIRSLIRPDGTRMTFRYQIYRLLSDQPSPYRVVNLIPTEPPEPVLLPVNETARHKAAQLQRRLLRSPWQIPPRES